MAEECVYIKGMVFKYLRSNKPMHTYVVSSRGLIVNLIKTYFLKTLSTFSLLRFLMGRMGVPA